jgi:hypothetical protein
MENSLKSQIMDFGKKILISTGICATLLVVGTAVVIMSSITKGKK